MVPGLLAACATSPKAVHRPDTTWKDWPLERRIAQMLMLGFTGETISQESPIAVAIRDYGIGGVVLFDNNIDLEVTNRNITGPAQLKLLTDGLRSLAATPLFISVDQEGGIVARLKERYGFPPSLSARCLGEKNDLNLTRSRSESMAATLNEFGFTLNLAPVVDLASNPDNPVIALKERSFSADPKLVAAHAAEFVKGHRSRGIATCLKHFPGHGSSRDDSHLGLVDVTEYWTKDELIPYRSLIEQGLCDMVMTAHTFNTRLDPAYPATLSKATIDGILRKDLGFNGVVLSDDLNMGAIIGNFSYETAVEKAVNAGVDILVVANDKIYTADVAPKTIEMLLKMVESGRIDLARIDEACGRVMALKARHHFG
jgi:beta-N-acetylhexosaminidase